MLRIVFQTFGGTYFEILIVNCEMTSVDYSRIRNSPVSSFDENMNIRFRNFICEIEKFDHRGRTLNQNKHRQKSYKLQTQVRNKRNHPHNCSISVSNLKSVPSF